MVFPKESTTRTVGPARLHSEGPILKAWMAPQRPSQADIVRESGLSKGFVSNILAGRKRPTPRFIEACRRLGFPVELIWNESGGT